MSELELIHKTPEPLSRESLARALKTCGLAEGQTVIVHSALSKLGWVCGGPVTVIQALLDVLGAEGTLVMPAHSGENTDPVHWQAPPVPKDWQATIRTTMPAFDPAITPTRQMGRIAELFRTWPGAVRSYHPTTSFAALGPKADLITSEHELEQSHGEKSPLGKLYDLNASVLLLGVGHSNNTSLHLAETRADLSKEYIQTGSAIFADGERRWVTYRELDVHSEDFEALGAAYEKELGYAPCKVGLAEARLLELKPLLDWAEGWLETHRH